MTRCRSCDRIIKWARTEGGNLMPLDPEPVADGNVEIVGSEQGMPNVVVHPNDYEWRPGYKRWRSHFVSCEFASQHRKAPA